MAMAMPTPTGNASNATGDTSRLIPAFASITAKNATNSTGNRNLRSFAGRTASVSRFVRSTIRGPLWWVVLLVVHQRLGIGPGHGIPLETTTGVALRRDCSHRADIDWNAHFPH